ncbi:anionic trypsin-1-like [Folsomia candida]|uniref:anionic trypsin-1-like n=1 Tax=Folsomia candida TaxID=158441 RepID=UPI001604AAE7|nr:anionic trypsin-1-like [Folsomia candida]
MYTIEVLITLLMGASAALPSKQIDISANPDLIVGGAEATLHEFKFIVDMRKIGLHYCVGSVISQEWVVIAAHCAQNPASSYTLTAGDHNIVEIEGVEQVRYVVNILIHPNYSRYVVRKWIPDLIITK